MSWKRIIVFFIAIVEVLANGTTVETNDMQSDLKTDRVGDLNNIFDGVYTECFLHLSYACLQEKTLLYLKELNKLSEVSVIGDFVKFVKTNETGTSNDFDDMDLIETDKNTEDLSYMIDNAIDKFFNNHILKFNGLGKDIEVPNTEEFVGRKRKGGGGGGGHDGGHDGGKKKMMMMAMMCMKMKLMMMIPAMMGMMGMMSFKGMMFSMMSFMISKMMLLMKLLEKKGGGGGGDGGWAAGGGGGGGGAWMPAGGDYGGGGGGGGGGYDANGQWQSRSILDKNSDAIEYIPENIQERIPNRPVMSYVTPIARYNHVNIKKPYIALKKLSDEIIKLNQDEVKAKPRSKRDVENKVYEDNAESFDDDSSKNEKFDHNGIDSYTLHSAKLNSKLKKVHPLFEKLARDSRINNDVSKERGKRSRIRNIERSRSLCDDKPDSYEMELDESKDSFIFPYALPLDKVDKTKINTYYENDIKHKTFVNINNNGDTQKVRNKRGIVDVIQNAYIYWMNRVLGLNSFNRYQQKYPKFKVINGVKYVYYPVRQIPKSKTPKELQSNVLTVSEPIKVETEGFKPIITADNFNKGEIVEGAVESRMTKKMQEFKDTVSDTLDDNPWQ